MSTLIQDLRYSARMLLKNPGFTVAAVVTLALGIGLNTTIFTFLKAVAIDSMPGVQEPSRIVVVTGKTRSTGSCCSGISYLNLRDLNARNSVFEGILGWELLTGNLSNGEKVERVRGTIVSGNYFDVLGVKAAIGRTFLPEEDQTPGTHPVLVINHGIWQRHFGGDPNIAGRKVTFNGHPYTIIGVTPAGFGGGVVGASFDVFAPVMMQAQVVPGRNLVENRGAYWFDALARLKPGVSVEQARAAMDVASRQLEQEFPGANKEFAIAVYSLLDSPLGIQGEMFPVLAVLMAVVGLVLLIGCANVANMLLARASARRKEIAVRIALGASRGRLLRQLLTESMLLALVAGAAGLLLAVWTTRAMPALLPPIDIPIGFNLELDENVLAFAVGISVLTGILFGIAPALRASRSDLVSTLKDTGATPSGARMRLRNVLIVSQVALSVVALAAAGLFLRGLDRARTVNPGFDSSNTLMASLDLFPNGYTSERGIEFYRQLLGRVEALPGVVTATYARRPPLTMRGSRGTGIDEIEGYQKGPEENIGTFFDTVGPRYFQTMKIPLLRGRDFSLEDHENATRVTVVNETMAKRFWPGQDPLGKRIRIGQRWIEIVGVARDVKVRSLGEASQLYMYAPLTQVFSPDTTLIVRTRGNPSGLADSVRREVAAMDKDLAVFAVMTMEEHANFSLLGQRTAALGSGVFGMLALTLAALGLYGVMAYAVAQRTREIGIRIAVGAQRRDVVRLVLQQGMRAVFLGLGIGLVGAFAIARLIASQLFGVSPADPVTFASIFVLMTAVGLAACYIPARRAMRVDPMVALRYE